MMVINTVYNDESITAIKAMVIREGLIDEVHKAGIPYSLAGSIRDDGPVPKTERIRVRSSYAKILAESDTVLMPSPMFHSIGTEMLSGSGLFVWISIRHCEANSQTAAVPRL